MVQHSWPLVRFLLTSLLKSSWYSGVLIQEQIITKLRQEGYVPASTLEVEVETEAEDEDEDGATGEVEDVFEISDDSDEEND